MWENPSAVPSRRGGGQQTGRCPYNRIVNFRAPTPVPAGRLVPIRVTAASPHSLIGALASERVPLELPLA